MADVLYSNKKVNFSGKISTDMELKLESAPFVKFEYKVTIFSILDACTIECKTFQWVKNSCILRWKTSEDHIIGEV